MAKKQATKDYALKIGDLIQGKPILDIEQRASGARQRGDLLINRALCPRPSSAMLQARIRAVIHQKKGLVVAATAIRSPSR